MAHPIGKKNVMRTPKEKEKIVLEYLNGKVGTRTIAGNYDIHYNVLKTWVKKYRKNGIEGLKSKTGKHNNSNSGRYNRHPSEVDKLKEELAKKDIEIERLKKGYAVKGVGARKEYVTTFDKNTK